MDPGAQKGTPRPSMIWDGAVRRGRGIGQDYAQAAYWYRRSADGGDSDAMCNLGWLYEAGQGVEQSWEKAAEWYLRSAEAGSGRAMGNLAWCYDNGKGVGAGPRRSRPVVPAWSRVWRRTFHVLPGLGL